MSLDEHSSTLDLRSRCIGIGCIFICVITWIGMAELEIILFANSTFSNKPFFLQYVANSTLMLCIVPWWILEAISRYRKRSLSRRRTSNSLVNNTIMIPRYHSIDFSSHSHPISNILSQSTLSVRGALFPSIIVSSLLAIESYLWFLSLYSTIVAVNTTIYQSQCVWVLLFSMGLLGTKLTITKGLSVIFSLLGVALISFLGQESEHNDDVHQTASGLALCLAASIIYALIQVMMSRFEHQLFDQEDHFQKLKDVLFFKFMMGVSNLTLWWPGFFILNFVGLESFEFPDSVEVWINIMTLSAVVLIFVISYLIGITYSGALFMSVGSLLVVPTSYVVDIYLYDLSLSKFTVLGSLCIVLGFLLMQRGHS